MLRPLSLIKDVLFRLAFGLCILIQLVLWTILLAGISALFPSDSSFVLGLVIFLLLLGPFVIGAANYFLYRRIIREQYICSEAKKWLEERRAENNSWTKRRRIVKRWAVWIPTVTVILICTFLDYTWAFASHLFHPAHGRLVGYEVSIPLTWVLHPDLGTTHHGGRYIVMASRFRGLWRASSGIYADDRPPFEVSTMNFRSTPGGNPTAAKPVSTVVSERTFQVGKDMVTCREETPPRWMMGSRYIDCSTPTGNFSAGFSGNDTDAAEFYRVIESAKQRE